MSRPMDHDGTDAPAPGAMWAAAADLAGWLAEHIWSEGRPLYLGGEEYEVTGGEEVPGYEDDQDAILLRRKSDGQVFDADIDVSLHPVQVLPPADKPPTPAEMEAAGQLRLPGVAA